MNHVYRELKRSTTALRRLCVSHHKDRFKKLKPVTFLREGDKKTRDAGFV